jgi:hypothetical protein
VSNFPLSGIGENCLSFPPAAENIPLNLAAQRKNNQGEGGARHDRALNRSFYHNDQERADALLFGRRTRIDRRGFFGATGLTAMGVALGGIIPFADRMPGG